MKKIIFSMVGISLLFLSCEKELIETQEDDSLTFSLSSSQVSVNCEPDLEAFELSLPETVTVNTVASPCVEGEGSFLTVDIPDGSLASVGNPGWCADLDGDIGYATYTFDVYSSYEDVSGLVNSNGDILFENADNFDKVNWVLNQSFIGSESPNGGSYTYGHVQWAIWELIEGAGNNCTDDCDYLSCDPIDQWDTDKSNNERLGKEIVAAAFASGEGFIPQCGQKIAIILASETVQSLIITKDVPEKETVCDECEGKVTDLTLQYNGTEKANIKVKTKKEGEDGSKVVFEGMVEAGAEFTFSGNDKKGTLGTEIKIYVNGDENTKIHTSCSKPIGPGLISGDFEVMSGSSREGGYLCPVDTPPGGDCGECEGKITDLELQYNGDTVADIVVKTKGKGKNKEGAVVFDGTVMPGESFSFTGNDKKGTLGTEITIYVDGNVNTKIHTSCSKPIGPGLISGSFEVISGSSREGGELCPVDVPPTGGEDDDCSECDGKITRLDLQYNGNIGANIKVVQKKDGIVVFSGNVNAGETFTFSGEDKKGTLGTEIIIYINDTESQRIHTSCSVYIGAGVVFGDFTVLGGASRNGGELCPADVPAAASGGH